MALEDFFNSLGAQAPKRPSTKAPKPLGVPAPESSSTEVPWRPVSEALRSISAQEAEDLGAQAPKPLSTQGAKSTHPDFAPVKLYLRKTTRKQAERKWEDAGGGDFSDLVEHLLNKYLGA